MQDHSLLLGPAERADVIVDFSKYAGKTLILYNDAPTAFPALDPRYDYYTGGPDLTDTGGTTPTQIGFGPNTRTIMQIKVAATTPAPAVRPGGARTPPSRPPTRPTASSSSRRTRSSCPDARYDSGVQHQSFPADPYVRIYQIQTIDASRRSTARTVTIPLEPKAIQDEMGEAFDPNTAA